MAALPLRASWSPPAAVAAASRSARPIHGAVHVHPLSRRGPSAAPAFRIEARARDVFYSNPHPAGSQDVPIFKKLRKYHAALEAAWGLSVPPDMFHKEKDDISEYMMKICSSNSRAEIETVITNLMPITICTQTQIALDLASGVIDIADIAGLGLGKTVFTKHIANQMVRQYTPIFCNVAEDAYHNRIKMDTVLSFLDALRGLGMICHMLVQDTVNLLQDGPLRRRITHDMETHSHDFDKKLSNMKVMIATEIEHKMVMMNMFSDGIKHVRTYIFQLVNCRRNALSHLLQGKRTFP